MDFRLALTYFLRGQSDELERGRHGNPHHPTYVCVCVCSAEYFKEFFFNERYVCVPTQLLHAQLFLSCLISAFKF
jgi:hypothetical protein